MTSAAPSRSCCARKHVPPPLSTLVPHLACSTPCYSARVDRAISQRELRNESGDIMRRVSEGETFVVTRNGVPVGELAPLRRHRFVSADAVIAMFHKAPSVDFDHLRADLDRVATQDATPRG